MQFRVSPVFELVVSMQGVADSWRMEDLANEVRDALGRVFIDGLQEFYRSFHVRCIFSELAVDYTHHDDVPGFFEYVESLSDQEFMFYALGRWFPISQIPSSISSSAISQLIASSSEAETIQQVYPTLNWVDDLQNLRKTLIGYWRTYWEGFLSERVPSLKGQWERSVREKREILTGRGGTALLSNLTGHDTLPDPLPANQPYNRVHLIPLCYTPQRKLMYYGYGEAYLLYDCRRTEKHEREVQEYQERSLGVLRALADENRLKLLKLVAQNERVLNGKCMAEKLDLSPSVVSRHLSQLRDGGLITEFSPDNRNIGYTFNLPRLRQLAEDLESYIHD
jgi:DNA-binding transcriptional ArsR family regulator